jgi:DNA polymerase-3 subunit gamma/tau
MHLLGGLDRQVLVDLSAAVFARDISRVLGIIDNVYTNGNDLKRFYTDLLAHFRHLMLIKMDARPELLAELAPGEVEKLTRQAQNISVASLNQIFTVLFNAETSVRYASQPRLAIEMAFFKIQQITPALPIDVLIERLDSLLKAPHLIRSQGIVEDQAAYGRPAPAPADTSGAPAGPRSMELSEPEVNQPPNPQQPEPSGEAAPTDDAWANVLSVVAARKPSIAAALARSQLTAVSEKTFTVAVRDNEYTINLIKKNLNVLEDLCREHAGRGIQIDFCGEASEARQQAASAKQKANEMRQTLLNHPLVADAVDIFSGKIEEIKIR